MDEMDEIDEVSMKATRDELLFKVVCRMTDLCGERAHVKRLQARAQRCVLDMLRHVLAGHLTMVGEEAPPQCVRVCCHDDIKQLEVYLDLRAQVGAVQQHVEAANVLLQRIGAQLAKQMETHACDYSLHWHGGISWQQYKFDLVFPAWNDMHPTE